jgi:hypothetical protein
VVVGEPANVSAGRFGLGERGIDGGRTSELTAGYANTERVAAANAGSPSCGAPDIIGPAWLRFAFGDSTIVTL